MSRRAAALLLGALLGCDAASDEPRFGLDERPANGSCLAIASPPDRLSEHPCFAGTPPAPGDALVPYAVNAPLWSDNADKERFLALPDDEVLRVDAAGRWEIPDGAVLVKQFALDARLLETRFLTRLGTDYEAYTYVWNADQTDAELVHDGQSLDLGDTTWSVPSEEQCFDCHTAAAGTILGLSTAQMNLPQRYPHTGRTANQIDTLAAVGMLVDASDEPLDSELLPRMPDYRGAAPVPDRARAYLHANCAHCHQPGSGGAGTMDLRFQIQFEFLGACDARPEFGAPGNLEARLLTPGAPDDSVISLRMRSHDADWQMPPLGKRQIDEQGVDLIDAWIADLESCP